MGLKKNNPGCNCCGDEPFCLYCDSTPESVTVTISGVQNTAECNECESMNGTYVLAHGVGCQWQLALTSSICGYSYITLRYATAEFGPDLYVVFSAEVDPTYNSGDYWTDWNYSGSDCTGWTDKELPTTGEDQCDLSGSTCLITAN